MTHRLTQPLIDSVCGVLAMMAQTPCDVVTRSASDDPSDDAEGVVGTIEITGALNASVSMRIPTATGRVLVERMTGQPSADETTVDDALGELCNMIVGSAKSSLDLADTTISCPRIQRTNEAQPAGQAPPAAPAAEVRFRSDAGPFTMTLYAAA